MEKKKSLSIWKQIGAHTLRTDETLRAIPLIN